MNCLIIQIIPWMLITVIYSPVFLGLYKRQWAIRDYTHAYFILPIALLIVWMKRKQLLAVWSQCSKKCGQGAMVNGLWLVVLIFGLWMFLFGWRQEYLLLQTLSFIFVLAGMVGFIYGGAVLKVIRFPLMYLLLLVPPPNGVLDNITLPMRYGISVVTEMILKVFQLPITREGLLLTIGHEEIYMGEPCSGFRSLITILSLGLVYIYFVKGSQLKNIILVLSLVPLALLGNLIRVVSMCIVTYKFGHEVGQGFYHDFSGMVVFAVIILGLIGLESLLEKIKRKT